MPKFYLLGRTGALSSSTYLCIRLAAKFSATVYPYACHSKNSYAPSWYITFAALEACLCQYTIIWANLISLEIKFWIIIQRVKLYNSKNVSLSSLEAQWYTEVTNRSGGGVGKLCFLYHLLHTTLMPLARLNGKKAEHIVCLLCSYLLKMISYCLYQCYKNRLNGNQILLQRDLCLWYAYHIVPLLVYKLLSE